MSWLNARLTIVILFLIPLSKKGCRHEGLLENGSYGFMPEFLLTSKERADQPRQIRHLKYNIRSFTKNRYRQKRIQLHSDSNFSLKSLLKAALKSSEFANFLMYLLTSNDMPLGRVLGLFVSLCFVKSAFV